MLLATRELDNAWGAAFQRAGLRDIHFSRLFTELRLRSIETAMNAAPNSLVERVSTQTAMKYRKRTIAERYLEEARPPSDGRSRLPRMSARYASSPHR